MAIRKSQLYNSIWQGCDELRGGMDASQYKDYVLVLLFVRYVSDRYAGKKDALVEVPAGGSFADLVKLKGKPNIGEGIMKVLNKLAEANELKGVINAADFNDEEKLGKGKDMQDRLSNLIAIFENPELDFSSNRAEGDDLLGDAYEYLMKNFAVQSGKSKGQFYTPAEVSRIIAQVIDAHKATGRKQTVYDPTCGSGSLLLKVAAETPKGIAIYGQELDTATAGLAILNMWLHNEPTAVIKKGQSTLSTPLFTTGDQLKTFDYVVANPPFSYKSWRNGFDPENDDFGRFDGFGIPPKKNGDYAFLLHILKSLKSTGTGAVVLPHGVLFRGNVEAQIRANVVKRGYIKGIIGLPSNLFFGTGIPACIIVLDKNEAANRRGIFMIDASKGYAKDGNKNRLREQDIRKIVDSWKGQLEIPKYSRFVLLEEISEINQFNLNLPRYIDSQPEEDAQDIEAHLKGGIPQADVDALSSYWEVCPSLKNSLFSNTDREGYVQLSVSPDDVRSTILSDKEFGDFRSVMQNKFAAWRKTVDSRLRGISKTDSPKAIAQELADKLLDVFKDSHLIGKYDIYQNLMTYWEEVMQDDVYIIAGDGWNVGNEVIRLQRKSKGKKKKIAGLSGLEGRLIPVSLMIRTYFDEEKTGLEKLNSRLEQIAAEMSELKEEHGGEDGLLSEVIDNDKITKGAMQNRIKEIKDDSNYTDELDVLKQYMALFDEESDTKKAIKHQESALEKKVIAKYPKLSLDEVKTLVVDHKWMSALESAVIGQVDQLAQSLADRVRQLAKWYAETLPELSQSVSEMTAKVDEHLTKMGFEL